MWSTIFLLQNRIRFKALPRNGCHLISILHVGSYSFKLRRIKPALWGRLVFPGITPQALQFHSTNLIEAVQVKNPLRNQ